MRTVASAALLVALAAAPLAAQTGVRYRVVDLGSIGGSSFHSPEGIAEDGTVAGFYFSGDGDYDAFIARPGEPMLDLGSLGGSIAFARAVNAQGEVVGFTTDSRGEQRGFLWRDGEMSDVAGIKADARAINEHGQIAGSFFDKGGLQRPFLTTAGDVIDLGTHGGEYGQASGVNNLGHAVGWAWDAARTPLATLWRDGDVVPLGALWGESASAAAINDRDQVVGTSPVSPDDTHAFLWEDGRGMLDLGVLPEASSFTTTFGPGLRTTFGRDINSHGHIVGNSWPPGGVAGEPGRPGPWIWQDGVMTNLNDLIDPAAGWVIFEAAGINDAGQIAALARRGGTGAHAVRLDLVCGPDCDGSGSLDFFDFLCFQDQFASGSPTADCDASGSLDFFDFLCFQNQFAAGCD